MPCTGLIKTSQRQIASISALFSLSLKNNFSVAYTSQRAAASLPLSLARDNAPGNFLLSCLHAHTYRYMYIYTHSRARSSYSFFPHFTRVRTRAAGVTYADHLSEFVSSAPGGCYGGALLCLSFSIITAQGGARSLVFIAERVVCALV